MMRASDVAAAMWRARGGRLGIVLIAGLVVSAAVADFVASDKPLLARVDGDIYVLANIFDPVGLRQHTVQSLRATMAAGDWMVEPPVPWGQNQQDIGARPLEAPSASHWLGTDTARRDVLARLLLGSRVAVVVGFASVLLYLTFGVALGLAAAWYGGWVDALVSRVADTVMSLPVFFLILAVMGLVEDAGVMVMVLVIAMVYWTRVARLTRAEALRVKSLEYIAAAKVLGYSGPRIMFLHMLPNCAGPILVAGAFGLAGSVMVEASLSFLGFGTPDTVASWGALLRGAMGNFHAWWLVLFPGLAIFLTVSAFNLAGEAMRDSLDPRTPR